MSGFHSRRNLKAILTEGRPMRILFAIFTLLVTAGCAATGPTSSPEYPSLVKAALPPEAGQLAMFGPGTWYPNTLGFNDIRTTMGYGATPPISSVIVVTDKALVVEQWDDRFNRFNVMKLLKIADLTEASLDTFGASTRLVIKSADFSYNSFDFTDGQLLDSARTKLFAAQLQQQIAQKLPKD